MIPAIFGCSGTALKSDEAAAISTLRPVGLILFKRNCQSPNQISELTRHFKKLISDQPAIIMIDEEGGSVQRMKPPMWSKLPPMKAFGDAYQIDPDKAVRLLELNCTAVAAKLREVGINTVAAPVLDLFYPQADKVIGSRSFSSDPETVLRLGSVACDTFSKYGVLPIIKHIPGHGRATADSHKFLPTVSAPLSELEEADFYPFKKLSQQPFGMIAHICYSAFDETAPASQSAKWQHYIQHSLGFAGMTVSDCIYMDALEGDIASRAKGVIQAGYDFVIASYTTPQDMQSLAGVCPPLGALKTEQLQTRINEAENKPPPDIDHHKLSNQINQELADMLS